MTTAETCTQLTNVFCVTTAILCCGPSSRGQEFCTIRLKVIATGITASIDEPLQEMLPERDEQSRFVRDCVMFSRDAFSAPLATPNNIAIHEKPIAIKVEEQALVPRLVIAPPACYVRFNIPNGDSFVPYFHSMYIANPTFIPEKLYPVKRREPLPILVADLLPWLYPDKLPPPRRAYLITNVFAGISDEHGEITITNIPIGSQVKFSIFHPDFSVLSDPKSESLGIVEKFKLDSLFGQRAHIDKQGRLEIQASKPLIDLGEIDIGPVIQAFYDSRK